jgi:hypothetical protein
MKKEMCKKFCCGTCYGKGEVMISCCTGDVVHSDYDLCPKCYEHMGLEECPDCGGTGLIKEEK